MKLNQIKIKKLFDLYNYNIDLSNYDNIKIITGPNGYGKSTIIRLVYQLYCTNFYHFFNTTFDQFELGFENEKSESFILKIRRIVIKPDNEVFSDEAIAESDIQLYVSLEIKENNYEAIIHKSVFEKTVKTLGFTKIEEDLWLNNLSELYISTNELIRTHPEIIDKQFDKATEILMFLGALDAVMIADQRLIHSGYEIRSIARNKFYINKVQVLLNADKLIEIIARLKSKFKEDLQGSMLKAFSQTPVKAMSESDYKMHLSKLNDKIKLNLIHFGIADESQIIDYSYPDELAVAKTNLLIEYENVVEKILNEIKDIQLFEQLIQNSEFPDKAMKLDTTNGYSFTLTNGTFLFADRLSSGEQHKLILYFKLLFEAQTGILVLIDEPELSFHVVWQSTFIEELKRIVTQKKLQAIVATHSPQIIDGKWSLTKDLFELNTNN